MTSKIRWAGLSLNVCGSNSIEAYDEEDVKRERGGIARELHRIHRKGKDSLAAWVLLKTLADKTEEKSK